MLNIEDIRDDLSAVGEDSITDLFSFVKAWNDTTEENGDFVDKIMACRMGLEVGLAIHLYAQWKELKCPKSEN